MCGQPAPERSAAPQLSTPEPLITQLAVPSTVNLNDEGGITPIIGTRVVPTSGNPTGEDTIRPSMLIPVQEAAATANIYQSYPDYGLIVQYQTQIADPNISEAYRAALRQALDSEMRAAEHRATEIALAPRTPILPTLQPTPPGGIYPTPEVARGIMEFDPGTAKMSVDYPSTQCTNMWQDVIGDYVTQIYACYQAADPGQAFLTMSGVPFIPDKPHGPHPSSGHPTPRRVGPVRIIDSQGYRLTVQADDGTRFFFDVETLQYSTSMTGTVTPIATAIPTPVETTAPAVVATPAPAP